MGLVSSAGKRASLRVRHLLYAMRYKFGISLDVPALKCLGANFAAAQSSADYDKLLAFYDADFKMPTAYVFEKFVGFDGVGEGTLNSFRVLRGPNGLLFEKIYLVDARDFRKLAHFLTFHQCAFLNNIIAVPPVVDQVNGSKLVGVYFQCVTVQKVEGDQYLRMARACMDILCRRPVVAELDDFLSDFYAHVGFSRCYRKTKDFLLALNGDDSWLDQALLRVGQMPRFYAHGDLSIRNMSSAGYVFDWDNSGYFPPGFDLALVLLGSRLSGHDSIAGAAASYYSLVERRCSFEDFHFSLLFLYAVLKGGRDRVAKTALLNQLKSLL